MKSFQTTSDNVTNCGRLSRNAGERKEGLSTLLPKYSTLSTSWTHRPESPTYRRGLQRKYIKSLEQPLARQHPSSTRENKHEGRTRKMRNTFLLIEVRKGVGSRADHRDLNDMTH